MAYKGECSWCGICCTLTQPIPEKGTVIEFRCKNLIVTDRIGRPNATICAVWDKKYDNMPIIMLSREGYRYPSRCLASYPRKHDAVPPECSYKFVPDELVKIQPQWSLGYLPSMKENEIGEYGKC